MGFIDAVIQHNDEVTRNNVFVLRAPGAASRRVLEPETPRLHADGDVAQCDEAEIFATELGRERDSQSKRSFQTPLTWKGVKLDFKRLDCVEPALKYLRSIDAARRLCGHLWLNADVLVGPGALLQPLDSEQFVLLCASILPTAVLSLSWGSSVLSTNASFSDDTVENMVKLCLSPFVPSASVSPYLSSFGGGPGYVKCHVTPAAACHHITFGVAAEYAVASATGLCSLLDRV